MQVRRKEGELGVYTGGSRQGKTAALKQRIKKHKRVVIWSVKESVDHYAENWRGAVIVRNKPELLELIRSYPTAPAQLVFVPPSMKDFGWFCRAAFAWGKAAPCSVVAEELADVTTPAKAPDGWGNLCRQGLGWGINIYAVTQRPAESDKTCIGNASFLHTHFMMRDADRAYMAREMNITAQEIAELQKLEWIERWADRRLIRGKVRF